MFQEGKDAGLQVKSIEVIEVPGLSQLERNQIRKLLKESIKASIKHSIEGQTHDSFLTSSVVINDEFRATLEGQ